MSDSTDDWTDSVSPEKQDFSSLLQELAELCQQGLVSVGDTMSRTTKAISRAPLYKQTNLELLDAVKVQHEELTIRGKKLTSDWEGANQCLHQLRTLLSEITANQQDFFDEAEDFENNVRQTMNPVCFSSSQNLQVLPMSTIKDRLGEKFGNFWAGTTLGHAPRSRIPIPNGFYIPKVAIRSCCQEVIDEDSKFFDSCSPVDARFRTNLATYNHCPRLAESLWTRIKSYFGRQEVVTTEEGLWKPERINEIWKVTKYLSGTPIVPHLPGPWIPRENSEEVKNPIPFPKFNHFFPFVSLFHPPLAPRLYLPTFPIVF
jgi:hypothetical protein